jgi:SET domain-containing protein
MAPDGLLIGGFIDPLVSLMNHSCEPHAIVVYEGKKLSVRSSRAIKQGEELLQCYNAPA